GGPVAAAPGFGGGVDGGGGGAVAVAGCAGRLLARGVPPRRRRRRGSPQAVRGDRRPAWHPADRSCAAAPRREAAPARTRRQRAVPREMEVADLVAAGLANPAIARRLSPSRATVASHVAHLLTKPGFSSRAQIAAGAAQRRTLTPGQRPGQSRRRGIIHLNDSAAPAPVHPLGRCPLGAVGAWWGASHRPAGPPGGTPPAMTEHLWSPRISRRSGRG